MGAINTKRWSGFGTYFYQLLGFFAEQDRVGTALLSSHGAAEEAGLLRMPAVVFILIVAIFTGCHAASEGGL